MLHENILLLRRMYDAARLVDPVQKVVLDSDGDLPKLTSETCYQYWKRGKICDNCVSMRAYLANKSFMKLEQSGGDVVLVTAIPLENTEQPLILELMMDASESMLIAMNGQGGIPLINNTAAEISDMILRDKLTGVYNRLFADERLIADVAKARAQGKPLSIMFMDVDNLKEINDVKGHGAGDSALGEIAKTILGCIRTDLDWTARYGGDEFIVCLHNTDGKVARQGSGKNPCKHRIA